ncbi:MULTISPECIES: PLP-dependent aminotransferase family protein [unclassified Variovorax]|uniref:aminotransferase-like domain-containing protein n=1 Tax=unclassified Variovorax TaxID=663243 RepID=UPI00076CD4DA|nr:MULTISPECIES: PLP-dependent aminotransferase family protein [unclassified Variovorax]KWT83905.1 Transcriptional regulator, GntR family domain [Variovorax sp. WDL1]PNG46586.1 2-aminoadipate transaminase [Variovorax sp. B2]PNG47592.1 2-aminoadipate transaminase [Variovorax sp. B4]VTV14360.1 putative HTH-type transcriptional regulator YjiR [Variovorax sp. WDL1]
MNPITPHWRKQLRGSAKPAYLLLADLIAEDIRSGRLAVRDRLPTLRELATDLQLNYTTVARGYAEARKRGLIDSRAGTGTFIRSGSPSLRLRGGSGAEMTMNMPPEPDDPHLLARLHDSASRAFADAHLYDLLRYQDFGGTAHDREAAMHWLRPRVPDAAVDRMLVCPGIHGVLTALFSQLARPGELICVESLTYPGVKAIAAQLGVQLHALQLDEDGPIADAFEHACRTLKPKALYCNPALLNPTTATVSRTRREALADVALRYAVPIIEDDAYGMLPRQSPVALATLAPALTYYVSGFSKCFGAGLRTAYVCSPTVLQSQRLAGAMRATTVMASPITNALATLWVKDGTAEAMLQAVRAESVARQLLASRHLGEHGLQAHPEGFHAWLPLTPGWSPVEFASYLRTQNVGVVASAAFSTDGDPPDAVRICLGGPMSRDDCDQALRLIADTLTHPLHPHATVQERDRGAVGAWRPG